MNFRLRNSPVRRSGCNYSQLGHVPQFTRGTDIGSGSHSTLVAELLVQLYKVGYNIPPSNSGFTNTKLASVIVIILFRLVTRVMSSLVQSHAHKTTSQSA